MCDELIVPKDYHSFYRDLRVCSESAQCVAASNTMTNTSVTDVARVSIPAQEPQCTSTATGNKTRRQKTRSMSAAECRDRTVITGASIQERRMTDSTKQSRKSTSSVRVRV